MIAAALAVSQPSSHDAPCASVPIDAALVRHVATLARLALTDAECEQFASDLGTILAAFESLSRVDLPTDAIHPEGGEGGGARHASANPGAAGNLSRARPDVVGETLPTRVLLSGAPDVDGAYVRVPALLDRD